MGDFYGIYNFSIEIKKKLSFAYFISNLIFNLSNKQADDKLWFLFLAKGGKEK